MEHLFEFHISPIELFARASLVYWSLFLLFRFLLKREAGSVGLADILVIVLIADAAQNGMAGDSKTVAESMTTVLTIGAWSYVIDWLSFRFPRFARFSEPRVEALIDNGQPVTEGLKRHLITRDELNSHLRQKGIEDVAQVKKATLEPDGQISVIRYAGEEGRSPT